MRASFFGKVMGGLLLPLFLGTSAWGAPVELGEVTVTAELAEEDRDRSPGSVTVLRPEEMQGERQTLPELLERVPGLHVVQAKGRGAYSVASIRGSTSAQVTVYVDGVKQNLESEAAVDLSSIPVGEVERIEVYKGYIPARFSAAGIGGVVNIVTQMPKERKTTLTLGAGSYGAFEGGLSYSDTFGGGKFFSALQYRRGDGDFKYRNDNGTPYNPADDYSARRAHNGYSLTDALVKWEDAHWSARLNWTANDRELAAPAPGADRPGSASGADLDTKRWDFSIGRRQTLGAVDWGWRLEYLKQDKTYDDPEDVLGGLEEKHNEYGTERFSVGTDFAWTMGDRHFLELAAAYASETLDVEGDIVERFGGRSSFDRRTWNVVLQDSIALTRDGTLLLTPSLRWQGTDEDDRLNWAVAVTRQFGSAWMLKATYGSYSRSPNMYELYGDGATIRPNENLRWETGKQWDLGVVWSRPKEDEKKPALSATLTYFGREADDMIEFVMTGPRFGVYENIGKARVHGVELEADLDWKPWKFSFSGTWMRAENQTADDYRNGKRLPNAPEWAYTARVTRFFFDREGRERFNAFLEGQYTGDNYFDQAEQVRYDDLFLLNLGLNWQINENGRFSFGVRDLLDEGPETQLVTTANGPERTPWYPIQGRTFYVTLRWTF